MVKSFTDLTKKEKKFLRSIQCENAVISLKKALVGTEIMGHPTNDDLFVLDVDATDTGIKAVLNQVEKGLSPTEVEL